MTAAGGKVMFFDPSPETGRHEVFFDDNIRYTDAYIVNPINIRSPARKQWVVPLLQTHLCGAEPLRSICETSYFVQEVARLEAGYERSLRARLRLRQSFQYVARTARVLKALRVALAEPQGSLPHHDSWGELRRSDRDISCDLL